MVASCKNSQRDLLRQSVCSQRFFRLYNAMCNSLQLCTVAQEHSEFPHSESEEAGAARPTHTHSTNYSSQYPSFAHQRWRVGRSQFHPVILQVQEDQIPLFSLIYLFLHLLAQSLFFFFYRETKSNMQIDENTWSMYVSITLYNMHSRFIVLSCQTFDFAMVCSLFWPRATGPLEEQTF